MMIDSAYSEEESGPSRQAHLWRLPDGTLHHQSEPALTMHFAGDREYECWVQHGHYERADDGPTVVMHKTYYKHQEPSPTDDLRTEIWATGPCGAADHPGRARKHRADGPAIVTYFRSGSVKSETWLTNNTKHRHGGPASIDYDLDGQVIDEQWFVDGRLAPGPSGCTQRQYFSNGQPKREMWLMANGLHREDGPAYLSWFSNGEPHCVEYWVDGLLTRSEGPAAIEYFATPEGQIRCEQWRVADRLHRLDGPAVTVWHQNSTTAETQRWFEGQRRTADGAAIERWTPDGAPLETISWSTEAGALDDKHYLPIEYVTGTELEHQWSEDVPNLQRRLWHRWMLGLEPAPDEAPFTMPDWINRSDTAELGSRLAYFPNGDALADRMLEWREWPDWWEKPDLDPETVTRAFVQFVRTQAKGIPTRELLLDQALAGEVSFSETTPIPIEGEYNPQDLNDIGDDLPIPHILFESIYAASGNNFLPIYWITEPMHGIDLTAWHDYERSGLASVVGKNGITIGPSH